MDVKQLIMQKIIFIGGGNMAEAIFAKLVAAAYKITVIQRNQAKRINLSAKYSDINFIPALDFNTTKNDIVVLAVKPQDAKIMATSVQEQIKESTIVSVMAGITVGSLHKWLNNDKIARCMPNTPATLGLGATGIYFSKNISGYHKQQIQNIFSGVGKSYIFDCESFIDKITPVGASSPAFVYYFIESLITVAIDKFGFNSNDARDITLQVIKGSLAMIEDNPDTSIEQLRANVTSKKGTTEAGVNVFEQANFKHIIEEAEVACYNRAVELGTLFT